MIRIFNPHSQQLFRLPATAEPYQIRDTVYPHEHSFTEIAMVLGGTASHSSVMGMQSISKGDVYLIQRGAWHGFQDEANLDLYDCHIAHDIMSHELLGFERNLPLTRLLGISSWQSGRCLHIKLTPAAFARAYEQMDAIYQLTKSYADHRQTKPYDALGKHFPNYKPRYPLRDLSQDKSLLHLRVTTHLFALMETLLALLPMEEAPCEGARDYRIAQETVRLFCERPAHAWTLDELAATLHFNRSYLVRLFKKVTGMPPLAYLFHLRAEEAAKLLVVTNRPVGDIGAQVGWTDAAYFSARFKAHFGVSPRAYRERFQKH